MPHYPSTRYDALLTSTFESMRQLARSKGGEYAHGDDRLDNFRRAASELGAPMELIWRVYAGKHWDSITTYVSDLTKGVSRERTEPIRGRIADLMVYLTLLLAMVDEREGGGRE